MIDIINKRCIHPDCNTQPNYNISGETKALYCNEHKLSSMIDIRSKRCIHPGCETRPNYNISGETKALYCNEHKLSGMTDVKNKRCMHPGCETQSAYNISGKTKPLYCSEHKLPGMINIVSKRCMYVGCETQPNYNISGETKPLYCNEHKLPEMVNVKKKRCMHPGCETQPNYNISGETKALYCNEHKLQGMIDIKHKRCIYLNCNTQPTYGKPGYSPSHCASHRLPGMIKRPNSKCLSCKEKAIYGLNMTPTHCEAHKEPDALNLVEQNCKSCGLLYVLDDNDHCEICDPAKFKRAYLAKQNALMDYLNASGYQGDSTDKVIADGACGKERPDRIIDMGDKIIVIECDENQHKDRPCSCEQTRMVNIGQSFGGIPVYFIRWNPDTYKTRTGLKQVTLTSRYAGLKNLLDSIKDNRYNLPKALVSVFYLYFDGWKDNGDFADTNWNILLAYETK